MTTNTAQVVPAARQDPRQVVNTLKKTINWNDAGIATGLQFDNSIPAGAFILSTDVEIVTTFNAGTTNVITIGTNSASYNNIVNSTDLNEAVTGVTRVFRGSGRGLTAAADVIPNATYTQTGTSATQGQAVIVITFEGGWSS